MKLTPDAVLDQQAKLLRDSNSGEEISLTFAETKVLACLAESEGEIISKEDLLQVGWPERVVAATSLTQCISTLRKKLEPYPQLQLKTLPRRGYQLHIERPVVAPVEPEKAPEEAKSPRTNTMLGSFMVVLLSVIIFVWYMSDYHHMLQERLQWQSDSKVTLNVGGIRGDAKLFYRGDNINVEANMWQKHLAPEHNHADLFRRFGAFASSDGNNYSIGICPDYVEGYCSGKKLLNIAATEHKPAGLNFDKFLTTRKVMEDRIKYNRMPMLPNDGYHGEVLEHYYHTNIYFPVADQLLVRADFSMSFVYEAENRGVFFSSTCLTDETCETTPVKYKMTGRFEQYEQHIGDEVVEVFHVTLTSKELTEPETVSPAALNFYRKLRKQSIFDEELYFYRVYQDDDTAVWLVPLMGDLSVWMTRSKLAM
ncbi:winged helix-turn-helix domain-containing protein [Ferrimonas lipolytica]|uniref:CadC family transcriptional regulator n=1 Tax=Ferrimonas lipolytica TaxID=2724191 RepID=A0A6H1UBA2_9GAMM|nr:winged helix-turn-helix domain-containing protein [Ferrimonas lipolytica]QIZ75486.1 CadC family transcriptional regulator [Ferrimonas lipolytica]